MKDEIPNSMKSGKPNLAETAVAVTAAAKKHYIYCVSSNIQFLQDQRGGCAHKALQM